VQSLRLTLTTLDLFLLPFAAKIEFFFGLRTYLIATSFLFIFLMINKTNKKPPLNENVYFSPSPKDTFLLLHALEAVRGHLAGRSNTKSEILLLPS
jgi:hypothetical protein